MAATGAQLRLVGRDRELAELAGLLAVDAPAGAGGFTAPAHVVLLAGDAGVGKTRLLTELRDHAVERGWQVAAGHCVDFGDSALPYLPFSEVLGRLAGDRPDLVAAVAEEHPALARLQPGRRVATEADGERSSVGRAELFEAVHALLGAAAARAPLLVVVEDAHWADSSTRDLVTNLCSRPHDAPVALVVSYRGEDLHRRHPLRAKVAEWSRIRGVERLQLEPLDEESVRELVRELQPRPMTEAELSGIVDRAEGNAFFVEELVGAASVRTRRGVPDDLAELLLVRVDRLDDAARRVVRTMSAAGRRVSHALLAAVSGLDYHELEEALRSAVENHVVVTAGGDSYSFRHALLAEAVYDDLLPGERVRLHAAYVAALRSGVVPSAAAELARHARPRRGRPPLRARPGDRRGPAQRRGGRRARPGAPGRRRDPRQRQPDARLPRTASDAVGAELRALFLLGRSWMERGRFDEACAAYARATARARAHGIPWAPYAFDARLDHVQTAYIAGEWDTALAVADVDGQAPPVLSEAMLVCRLRLAEVHRAAGDLDATRALAAHATEAATALGASVLLGALRALGTAPRRAGGTAASPDAVALTPRELEILGLVAEGRSNGAIGRQLFISAKTVSVHVSNILAKLGATGRTEAAAIARRRGLLG